MFTGCRFWGNAVSHPQDPEAVWTLLRLFDYQRWTNCGCEWTDPNSTFHRERTPVGAVDVDWNLIQNLECSLVVLHVTLHEYHQRWRQMWEICSYVTLGVVKLDSLHEMPSKEATGLSTTSSWSFEAALNIINVHLARSVLSVRLFFFITIAVCFGSLFVWQSHVPKTYYKAGYKGCNLGLLI